MNIHNSSLSERKEFYKHFKNNFKKYIPIKNPAFSLVIGRRTSIFPQKYKSVKKDLIMLDTVKNFQNLKSELLEFLPESVFFSRTLCDSPHHYYNCTNCQTGKPCKHYLGQMLMIDLDPENIRKTENFSLSDFEKIKQETLELYDSLPFTKKQIVFSGRGFHIYILDKDTFSWTRKQRTQLAKQITKQGYHHDEWVCTGEYDQARLPFSLNGISNKVCIPLRKKEVELISF